MPQQSCGESNLGISYRIMRSLQFQTRGVNISYIIQIYDHLGVAFLIDVIDVRRVSFSFVPWTMS